MPPLFLCVLFISKTETNTSVSILVHILVNFHFIPSTNNYFLSAYSESGAVLCAGDGGGKGETGMDLNLTELIS